MGNHNEDLPVTWEPIYLFVVSDGSPIDVKTISEACVLRSNRLCCLCNV